MLVKLGIIIPPTVMYISGSETLPPPLSREEEAKQIELLSQGDELAKRYSSSTISDWWSISRSGSRTRA
jgi:hypothetical protein